MSSRRVALATVTGWGAFGKRAVRRLEEYLPMLPEESRAALRFDHSVESGEQVVALRNQVATHSVVEELLARGCSLEGGEIERYVVHHVFVGAIEEHERLWQAMETLSESCPGDRVFPVVSVQDMERADRPWPFPETAPCIWVVSPHRQDELTLSDDELVDLAAAVALLALIPGTEEVLTGTRGAVCAVGVAGYCGFSGGLRRRLGEWVARSAVQTYLQGESVKRDDLETPGLVANFVEKYAPERFPGRLLDPRRAKELAVEEIPAIPKWTEDGRLLVQIQRSPFRTELRRGQEREWPRRIRLLARVVEMSLGSVWRQTVEAVAAVLRGEIKSNFLMDFRRILRETRYAPVWAERALKQLEGRFERKRRPMGAWRDDLESAIERLKRAIAAQPNPLVLTGRMALMVVPALVAAGGILFSLYPDLRAPLFEAVLVATAFLAGGGAVAWRILRSAREMLQAREKALGCVLERQEVLISGNVIGYLEDMVGVLMGELEKARNHLTCFRGQLEEVVAELGRRLATRLPDGDVLAPLLSDVAEVNKAADALCIDPDAWATATVEQGLMRELDESGEAAGTRVDGRLVPWCMERLAAGKDARPPSFGELLEIRREVRRTGTLAELVEAVYRRAIPSVSVPLEEPQSALFLVPDDLENEVREAAGSEDGGIENSTIQGTAAISLLACIRQARVRIIKRGGHE